MNGIKVRKMDKNSRAEKWDFVFIPCMKHPSRRCNRSAYVSRGNMRCGSCKNISISSTKAYKIRKVFHQRKRRNLRNLHEENGIQLYERKQLNGINSSKSSINSGPVKINKK